MTVFMAVLGQSSSGMRYVLRNTYIWVYFDEQVHCSAGILPGTGWLYRRRGFRKQSLPLRDDAGARKHPSDLGEGRLRALAGDGGATHAHRCAQGANTLGVGKPI